MSVKFGQVKGDSPRAWMKGAEAIAEHVGPFEGYMQFAERMNRDRSFEKQVVSYVAAIGAEPSAGILVQAAHDCVVEPYLWASWAQTGFNVVRPSADLIALWMATDVMARVTDIRFPFPSFVVELGELAPGWARIESQGEKQCARHLFVCSAVSEAGGSLVQGIILGLIAKGGFLVYQKGSVERLFEEATYDALQGAFTDDDALALRCARQVIASLLLWWSAHRESDTLRCESRANTNPKRRRPTLWVARNSIPLKHSTELIAAARRGPTGATWELDKQHIVRGHWRNQACGPGLSRRELRWIQPYWKGPDVDEAWARIGRDETQRGVSA